MPLEGDKSKLKEMRQQKGCDFAPHREITQDVRWIHALVSRVSCCARRSIAVVPRKEQHPLSGK
jgi:hypothetical protein